MTSLDDQMVLDICALCIELSVDFPIDASPARTYTCMIIFIGALTCGYVDIVHAGFTLARDNLVLSK